MWFQAKNNNGHPSFDTVCSYKSNDNWKNKNSTSPGGYWLRSSLDETDAIKRPPNMFFSKSVILIFADWIKSRSDISPF